MTAPAGELTSFQEPLGRRPLVLVIDDSKLSRLTTVRTIRALGYEVIEAVDGLEGLELANAFKPDLIIADAFMPNLGGREMSKRLKDEPATAALRIVIVSAIYSAVQHVETDVRADEYRLKPLRTDQIRGLLERYIGPFSE